MKHTIEKYFVFLLVIVSVCFSGVQAFLTPDAMLYSIDEKILWEQSIFLHFNCKPIALEWPGIFFSFILYGFSWISVLIQTPFLSQLLSFNLMEANETYIRHLYILMHDSNGIVWGRILLVALKVVTLFIVYRLTQKESLPFRLYILTALGVSFGLFVTTSILHPDGLAVYIWIIIFVFLHTHFDVKNHRHYLLLGILCAALCATKITYGISIPVLILYLMTQKDIKPVKMISIWLIGFATAFCLFCPYTVLSPITLIKAFVSNLTVISGRTGDGNPLIQFLFTRLPQNIGIIGFLLVIPGLVIGYRHKKRETILAILLLLVFSLPVMNVTNANIRYTMPLVPILVWYTAIAFQQMATQYRKWVVPVLGVMALVSFIQMYQYIKFSHQPSNMRSCIDWVKDNIQQNSAIEAHASLIDYLDENDQSLNELKSKLISNERYQKRLKMLFNKQALKHASDLNEAQTFFFQNVFHEEYAFNETKLNLKQANLNTLTTPKYNLSFTSSDPYRWPPFVQNEHHFENDNTWYITTSELDQLKLVKAFTTGVGSSYYVYQSH